MEEEKKLSEESEKFFEFLKGPAIQEKIMEYIKDAEKYPEFKKAVKDGEIAFIFAFGQSGWSCFGSDEGVHRRLFNIILNALRDKVITEDKLLNMVAFICAGLRKEEKDGKEES